MPDIIKIREKSETAHFDALATEYDKNYGYFNQFFEYKKIKKLTPLTKLLETHQNRKLNILEIGCGTGEYTRDLSGMFPRSQITAVDISPKIINQAKKKCAKLKNVKFKVASAYSLPFRASSFDLVCGFYIAHHLELPPLFEETRRVLKKGTVAYFVEPNLANPIVYLIKNISWLKKKVGDSPYETAINPFTLSKDLPGCLRLKSVLFSEYIPQFGFLSFKSLKFLDNITSLARFMPGIRYLGGTIIFAMQKQ